MNSEEKLKIAQDLCEIRETGVIGETTKSYTLKVPLTETTYHTTREEAIETRDKVLAKLLWTPPY